MKDTEQKIRKKKDNTSSESTTVLKTIQAEDLKVKGNECLKSGELDDAIGYYSKSLKVLVQPHVLNNRSLAYYKKKYFTEAMEDANASIQLDSGIANVKAYLRRAMAKKSKGL